MDGDAFYEAIFDVFSLRSDMYGTKTCQCLMMDQECFNCMVKENIGVRRYKAYMRIGINFNAPTTSQLVPTENPYNFKIKDYYLMEYRYVPLPDQAGVTKSKVPYSPWEDANNILD